MIGELLTILWRLLVALTGFLSQLLLYAAEFGMQFLILIVIAIIIGLFLAPFDALRWWSQQSEDSATSEQLPHEVQGVSHFARGTNDTEPDLALVYLSGIGDTSGDYEAPNETRFLDTLQKHTPSTLIVRDVFAFSVARKGLERSTTTGHVWEWLHQQKTSHTRIAALGQIINIRNLMQVLVSADHRYGPIYSYGIAEVIIHRLLRHGYRLDSGVPVVLLGYSGGGQVSLGAARYLAPSLNVPVWVISMGGVLSSDPGLNYTPRLYHIYGEKDGVQRIGQRVFPGRWPIARHSFWNIARHNDRINFIDVGPIGHNGPGGYLDPQATLPDGTPFLDRTVATLVALLDEIRAEAAAGPPRAPIPPYEQATPDAAQV